MEYYNQNVQNHYELMNGIRAEIWIIGTAHTTKGPFMWGGIWVKELGMNMQVTSAFCSPQSKISYFYKLQFRYTRDSIKCIWTLQKQKDMIPTNKKKRTNFSYGIQNGFKKIIKKNCVWDKEFVLIYCKPFLSKHLINPEKKKVFIVQKI